MASYPIPINNISIEKLENGKEYYAVYGYECFPSILRFQLYNDNIFGHSIWRRNSGFRTLSHDLDTWVYQNKLAVFFLNVEDALEYLTALMTIPITK